MTRFRTKLLIAALSLSAYACAQTHRPESDFALSFTAEHGNPVGGGGNFWLEGGSAEYGLSAWHGLGVAANFTGTHTSSFGPSAIPLGLITVAAGPRYRFLLPQRGMKGKTTSIYLEGLVGEAHGFDSLFPAQGTSLPTANSLMEQFGGGVDINLSHRFSIRALQASWVHMQLPNSTTNAQNDLRLGAGLAIKF